MISALSRNGDTRDIKTPERRPPVALNRSLPDLALADGIHLGAGRAAEVPRKVGHVGEGSEHAELARGVHAGRDALAHGLRPVLGAPRLGGTHPEHLARGERRWNGTTSQGLLGADA